MNPKNEILKIAQRSRSAAHTARTFREAHAAWQRAEKWSLLAERLGKAVS